ncbi:MAG: bifunctional phosphoribosylaminoimidazolecarboxamide formyltransferase/IMP cyclohydrolase [Pseudomonadota bacterium]
MSLYYKSNLLFFAKNLISHNIEILSTGGTAKYLKDNDIPVQDISQYTKFPEIMDGRVKTLHPKVHGGLLAIRDNEQHLHSMNENRIENIDLLVVNLYPFVETVKSGSNFSDIIENIDIGGPAMIRSAAKNHHYVTVVTAPNDYENITDELIKNNGFISSESKKYYAAKAFALTSGYDSAISNWFNEYNGNIFSENINIAANLKSVLRYGENPQQKAALYRLTDSANDDISIINSKQIQGKELSYNNILDADAALKIVLEFQDPTVAIIKHTNPCGLASDQNINIAFEKAYKCDSKSAFGGIFAFNREITIEVAEKISAIFVEVIIAPAIDKAALEILSQKKNMRILLTGDLSIVRPTKQMNIKSVRSGLLIQENNNVNITSNDIKVVTKRQPTAQEMQDLLFAFNSIKYVKSNAIIIAKDLAAIGIGAGQMSRIDSVEIAVKKMLNVADDFAASNNPYVLASDAFFPFADGLEIAIKNGITAAIQPGGSTRDAEVIKLADEHNVAMLFTGGVRYFCH